MFLVGPVPGVLPVPLREQKRHGLYDRVKERICQTRTAFGPTFADPGGCALVDCIGMCEVECVCLISVCLVDSFQSNSPTRLFQEKQIVILYNNVSNYNTFS